LGEFALKGQMTMELRIARKVDFDFGQPDKRPPTGLLILLHKLHASQINHGGFVQDKLNLIVDVFKNREISSENRRLRLLALEF
jgi:hypothetical protein